MSIPKENLFKPYQNEVESLEEINFILWNETAYPFCDTKTLYKQCQSSIRAKKNKIQRCEMCCYKIEVKCKNCR